MSAQEEKKPNSFLRCVIVTWLIVAGICALPFVSCLAMPEPEATAKQFKVGSKLSELKAQLAGWTPSEIEVESWISTDPYRLDEMGILVVTGEAENFRREIFTAIEDWHATASERDAFTGRITMYHHSWVIPDDFAPSFAVDLYYINGVLKKVDYGILPG